MFILGVAANLTLISHSILSLINLFVWVGRDEEHCIYAAWLLAITSESLRFIGDGGRCGVDFLANNIKQPFIVFYWFYGGDSAIFHHHRQTHHPENVDVNGGCVGV